MRMVDTSYTEKKARRKAGPLEQEQSLARNILTRPSYYQVPCQFRDGGKRLIWFNNKIIACRAIA
jgi:hypothetical protein